MITLTYRANERIMKKLVEKIIQTDYPEFHYRFLHFLCRHMLDISAAFNGDLDKFILLLVMDERYWKWRHEIRGIKDPQTAVELESFSVSKLASITSIPRETIRRKMIAMEKRGWVLQKGRGKWKVARSIDRPSVENELDDLIRREIARVSDLVLELQTFIEKPDNWKSKFTD